MKTKNITELTNEELIKNEKQANAFLSVFVGIYFVLLAVTIIRVFTKGFDSMVATPVAIVPILFILVKNRADLKKELKARNL